MSDVVKYELKDSIATIVMDDGKVNALTLEMFKELNSALDQAETDKAVVVLTGREGARKPQFPSRSRPGIMDVLLGRG